MVVITIINLLSQCVFSMRLCGKMLFHDIVTYQTHRGHIETTIEWKRSLNRRSKLLQKPHIVFAKQPVVSDPIF